MKLNRRRTAVATIVVTALIGWAGAGIATADSSPDESKWDGVVLVLESKWD